MIGRITLNQDFVRSARVRGLTATALAERAGVSLPTALSALKLHPINLTSALRLCRAVAAAPVIEELDRWVEGRVPDEHRPAA